MRDFAVIERRYLLVTHHPYYQDEGGAVWLERLWHRDVLEHLSYLKDFTLCAPCLAKAAELDLVRLVPPPTARLRVLALPVQQPRLKAILSLFGAAVTLWRAIGGAEIVHSQIIRWPPTSWLVSPVARLRRKRLVLVVENASWQRGYATGARWPVRAFQAATEVLARWSCNHADLALFTQAAFREALFTSGRGVAYVTPAVWVNEDDVLDRVTAEQWWDRNTSKPVQLLFAGQLVISQGVDVLLAALRELEGRSIAANVDVIGAGPRREAWLRAAAEFDSVRLRVLDPVPYGSPFLKLIDGYHALLIPRLSEEQPRVLFDANARAKPVIGSRTPGIRPHVEEGRTGWLVTPSDVKALASAIERASTSAQELRVMGLAALEATRGFTHRRMHQTRSRILEEHCFKWFGSNQDPLRQPARAGTVQRAERLHGSGASVLPPDQRRPRSLRKRTLQRNH